MVELISEMRFILVPMQTLVNPKTQVNLPNGSIFAVNHLL